MHRLPPEGGAAAPPSVVRGMVVVCLALAAVLVCGTADAAAPVLGPGTRCYGAADRVAARPCHNPDLDLQVFPTPEQAVLVPDAPCGEVEQSGAVQVCRFGAPLDEASDTVALLGDSHASHWRAALGSAAARADWHLVGMTRSGCPFTRARPDLVRPSRSGCRAYNDDVVTWLDAHPEVHTVFVSAIASARVLGAAPADQLSTMIFGYQDAWEDLPPTVTRVIVLRDPPTRPSTATDCIEAAIRAGRPSMPVCAVPRARRLVPDPSVIAARRLRTRRVQVVDLSDFMCSQRQCFPVVGGVLVNKDTNHLSQAFSATLGPYLLRRAIRVLPESSRPVRSVRP